MVFGGEDVLPLVIQISSLRVASHEEMTNEKKANLCLAELEALDKNKLVTQLNLEITSNLEGLLKWNISANYHGGWSD